MFDPRLTDLLVHDLRNPLAGIDGSVDLFTEGLLGPLTTEQKKYVDNIQVSGRILANLLSDIQDAEHLEGGRLKPAPTPLSTQELIDSLKWLQDFAGRENKIILINADQSLKINGDKSLLTRILENLILNAVHQTKTGEKAVFNLKKENGRALFEIIDQGETLPKEHWPAAFDKYFKSDHPEFKTRIGRGLGLYFCKLAVEAQGGKIWLESDPKKGTVISFII